jgi:hypothetical protein
VLTVQFQNIESNNIAEFKKPNTLDQVVVAEALRNSLRHHRHRRQHRESGRSSLSPKSGG